MPVLFSRGWLVIMAGFFVLATPGAASPSATALVGCLVVAAALAATRRDTSTGVLGAVIARDVAVPSSAHPVVRQSQPTAPGRTQARAPGRTASAPTPA